MADGITPAHWVELRTKRPRVEDALSTLPVTWEGSETPLLLAIGVAGDLHLLIPVTRG
jgi:hypothetical protein